MALVYLQGLANQVTALDRVLADSRRQLNQIPAKQLQFARLQREVKGLEDVVTLLQTRLKEAEIAQAVEDPSVRIVDAAILPRKPVTPRPLVNLSLAFVLGIGLGSAVACLREYWDGTVRSRHDVLSATGVPVLGLLPRVRDRGRWRTALGLGSAGGRAHGRRVGRADPRVQPAAPASVIGRNNGRRTLVEAFNLLGTHIALGPWRDTTKLFTVTSPLPAEGKTTVAANLALTLARRGARVLLVDADLRRGTIARVFGIAREPGLSDVLLGTAEFQKATHSIPVNETEYLHLLTRGRACHDPVYLLGSAPAHALFRSLRDQYDSIIVDTPPVNVVADASVIGAHSDAVIVVARVGVTDGHALGFAMEQLGQVGAPVVGTVLNDIDFRRDAAYDDAYRYYAHSGEYAVHTS